MLSAEPSRHRPRRHRPRRILIDRHNAQAVFCLAAELGKTASSPECISLHSQRAHTPGLRHHVVPRISREMELDDGGSIAITLRNMDFITPVAQFKKFAVASRFDSYIGRLPPIYRWQTKKRPRRLWWGRHVHAGVCNGSSLYFFGGVGFINKPATK